MKGWIGVDLDRTLAYYNGWLGKRVIGEPIPAMVERIKKYRKAGIEIRIFTARIDDPDAEGIIEDIQDWTEKHLGERLPVTNVKTLDCLEIWDDRARQVIGNTGKVVGESCIPDDMLDD